MVLFLAVGGCIFQNFAIQKITTALPSKPEAEIESLMAGTSSQAYQELSSEERQIVITNVTSSMGVVWIFFAVAAALSFLASLPLLVWMMFRYFDGPLH
jgi:6-phosphogluconate dehydrogenase